MKLSTEILKPFNPCSEGLNWYINSGEPDTVEKTVKMLIAAEKTKWANWLIVRMLSATDKIRYAVFAAEQVIDIYEKQYPNDKRPRQAIEAAKAVIKNNTEEKRTAANAAAYSAYAYAYSANAANAAANAAYAAADAAAYAAGDAANTAYAAGAADAAANAERAWQADRLRWWFSDAAVREEMAA